MKTKPFLLATAGSTVDGRTIDDKMLEEMASSYDPKTYGARLNIEHIRGISGDKPFRAYGDVLELSVGETEVNFNGQTEKRKALFGVFDVTDDAKALNDAGQKIYPSVEIEPNFGGKGYAYLMGCALTDSPASIGTERLQFNRSLPGTITLTAQDPVQFELAAEETKTDEAVSAVAGFFTALSTKLGLGAGSEPAKPAAPAQPEKSNAPQFDAAAFTKDLGETLTAAFTKQAEALDAKLAPITAEFTALKKQVDTTADPHHSRRPAAAGEGNGHDYSKVF